MTRKLILVSVLASICLLTIGCGRQKSPVIVPNADTLEQDKLMQQEHEKQMEDYLDSLKSK